MTMRRYIEIKPMAPRNDGDREVVELPQAGATVVVVRSPDGWDGSENEQLAAEILAQFDDRGRVIVMIVPDGFKVEFFEVPPEKVTVDMAPGHPFL